MRTMDDFSNVSIDQDTVFIMESLVNLTDTISAKYEMWTWDVFKGHTLVFINEDIAGMSDDQLIELAWGMLATLMETKKGEVVRREDFTFLNFGTALLEPITPL